MTMNRVMAVVAAGLVVLSASAARCAERSGPPSPRDVLGLDVGSNRVLASYAESERYLRALAERSDRVRLVPFGTTVEGRTMLAVAVSTATNIARLDELRAGWARVADPRGVGAGDRERLAATLPSCALITAGIHANEVAGPQAALLFVHQLAAAPPGSSEATWLEHVVVLVVPSLNPDGQDAVVAWYRKWMGTPYEGSQLPFLYHRYAGHDNNRDFVYLTQPESRSLNRLVYADWHPQLFLDLHMMGSTGPRQFVPPFADPVAPNVAPLVWRITSHLGTLMSLRLEEQGATGVVSGWVFDGNWIGGTRNTGWWKNVFGVLTETASAALATPVVIDENELHGGGKGLTAYRAQVSFPNPWTGGTWGLADAVRYQLTIMRALVEFADTQRAALLRDVTRMAGEAVLRGQRDAPRAYVIPADGDPGRRARLITLLLAGGVEGYVAPDGIVADGIGYPGGAVVFAASQPLRQFLVEVMERQRYPEVSPAPGADILLPYDITAWTMPLMLGVRAVRVEREVAGNLVPLDRDWTPRDAEPGGEGDLLAVPSDQVGVTKVVNRALARGAAVVRLTEASKAAGRTLPPGSIVVGGLGEAERSEMTAGAGVTPMRLRAMPSAAVALRRVRVGVYHPNFGLEESGWLRYVLEQAGFEVEVVESPAVSSGAFRKRDEVLVLPPMEGKVLLGGPEHEGLVPAPPEYRKGIGKEGAEQVRAFFESGGTVLAFGPSAEWLAAALELPVANALKEVRSEEFRCPGALLDVAVDPESPLGWGMPERTAVMFEGATAFQTRPVGGEVTRTVAARFPDGPLLASGWIRGEEKLRRRAAIVEIRRGAGRAVLYAFAPYFRGQTEAVFPLLFNAVLERMAEPPAPPAPPKGKKH